LTSTPPTIELMLMNPSRLISAKWSICTPVTPLIVWISNRAPAASLSASEPSASLYPRPNAELSFDSP
jgi:hypothetical protein